MMNTLTLLACLYIQFVVAELNSEGSHPLTAATYAYMALCIELDRDFTIAHRLELLLAVAMADKFLREHGRLPELPDGTGR